MVSTARWPQCGQVTVEIRIAPVILGPADWFFRHHRRPLVRPLRQKMTMMTAIATATCQIAK